MSVSTIPALRTALLVRLAAETWPTATPQITRSHPYPAPAEAEMVYLAGTQNDDPIGSQFGGGQTPSAFGMERHEERYVQTLMVSIVKNAREDVAVMEARAFEIAGVIETSIRNWRSTATPYDGVVIWCIVSGVRLDSAHLVAAEAGSPPSREVLITIELACAAGI
jgi:hypothetical protein